MRGVREVRLRALAFASAACSLLSCVLAQTPEGAVSPLPPLFPGFSTEALSRDASSEGDFGVLGAFDTAQSRVRIPATDGTAQPVAGVPDLGGETGEVLCTHPVVAETSTRVKREPNLRFPLVLYLHPLHGLALETWIAQNDAMLRLLASRGFVVCSPTMVGARGGEGATAPIVGGLFPGAQHTAAVAERRVFPRFLAFAPRAAAHLVRLGAFGSADANVSFPATLDRAIDPERIAFAGFSSGGAMALYAADEAERKWPGATRAAVALAPTVGDFAFARERFERSTRAMRVPMMLIAGTEDGMGGMDGLVEVGDAATRAPRVGVAVAGASHCHLYVPLGSECDPRDPARDKGGVGALGRFATTAFLHAYFGFPGDSNEKTTTVAAARAIDASWGGAEALNRFGGGAWNARVLVEPLVELSLFSRDAEATRAPRVASASYAYDPAHDAWTATVLLRVVAKRDGCLTEARVVPAVSGRADATRETHPPRSSAPLRAFLDATPAAARAETRATPPQPVGPSTLVFPIGDGVENGDGDGDRGRLGIVGLVLEWRADAFDARGAPRDARALGARRLLGGDSEDVRPDALDRERDRRRKRKRRPGRAERAHVPTRPSADVFVDGEFEPPPEDPVAERAVRAFGTAGPETDSTLPPRRTETVRVRALDACDGGTAAFLTLEVAPPRLAETSDALESESAVGAFGAREKETEPARETSDASRETNRADASSPAVSWEDALVGRTGAFASAPSRWARGSG